MEYSDLFSFFGAYSCILSWKRSEISKANEFHLSQKAKVKPILHFCPAYAEVCDTCLGSV